MAFEIHRSPVNLAAKINNLSYTNVVSTLYQNIYVLAEESGGSLKVGFEKQKAIQIRKYFNEQIGQFKTALTYEPNSVATMISIAETLCSITLIDKSIALGKGEQINFDGNEPELVEAMKIIKDAKTKGFSDWTYLMSRTWISHTLLRIPKYSKELLELSKF